MRDKQKTKKIGRPPIETKLPEWFSLKKYDAAKNLSFGGWYEQLYCRWMIIQLIRIIPNHTSQEWIARTKEAISLVRENPIIDVTSSALLKAYFYSTPDQPLAALKENRPLDCLGMYITPCLSGCHTISVITSDEVTKQSHVFWVISPAS